MADFCRQCSLLVFGEDFRDMAGLSNADDTANGLYALVLCEGCGPTQVDHDGQCIATDCISDDHDGHRGREEMVLRIAATAEGRIPPGTAALPLRGRLRVIRAWLVSPYARLRMWWYCYAKHELRRLWFVVTGRRKQWEKGEPVWPHVDV